MQVFFCRMFSMSLQHFESRVSTRGGAGNSAIIAPYPSSL